MLRYYGDANEEARSELAQHSVVGFDPTHVASRPSVSRNSPITELSNKLYGPPSTARSLLKSISLILVNDAGVTFSNHERPQSSFLNHPQLFGSVILRASDQAVSAEDLGWRPGSFSK